MNLVKMTLRQAKNLAKKADGPFSCNISARECEAPFYGLSTVAVIYSRLYIMCPGRWDAGTATGATGHFRTFAK